MDELKRYLENVKNVFGVEIRADTLEEAKKRFAELGLKSDADDSGSSRKSSVSLPKTIDKEKRTVDCVIATEKPVWRYDWWTDVFYKEILLADGCRIDEIPNGELPMVDGHNTYSINSQLGSTVDIRLEGNEIVGTRVFSSTAEKAFVMTAEGHLKRQSVQYRIAEKTILKPGESFQFNGRTITNDDADKAVRYYATNWLPLEDSIIIIPADEKTGIRTGSGQLSPKPKQKKGNDMNKYLMVYLRGKYKLAEDADEAAITAHLSSVGTSVEDATAEFERSLIPAVVPKKNNSAGDAVAERKRAKEILVLCRAHGIDEPTTDAFIDEGRTIEAVRSAILDEIAARTSAIPGVGKDLEVVKAQADKMRPILRDSLLLRSGIIAPAKAVEGARDFAGMTMTDFVRSVLEMNGQRVKLNMKPDQLFARAMTTADFPNVLSNVVQASLMAGFEQAEESYPQWCDMSGRVNDFREAKFARMLKGYQLKEVKEGEDYTYDYATEDTDTVSVAKYGVMVRWTWEAMINDYLAQITDDPFAFGQAAKHLEGDMAYDILIDNPAAKDGKALFHIDHNNLDATGAKPTEASISAAITAMATQLDSDGVTPVYMRPSAIIAPMNLSLTIDKLLRSAQFADGNAAATQVNTVFGRLKSIYESRLDAAFAATVTGGGFWPWFVSGPPRNAVKFFYLSGYESVSIESKETFENDSFTLKVRHICNAKAMSHQGLYKNVGATLAAS